MGAHWCYRLVRDKMGRFRLAYIRQRAGEDTAAAIIDLELTAESADDMKAMANEILSACDRDIVDEETRRLMALNDDGEYEFEEDEEDEDENIDYEEWATDGELK